jgi:hypothetical protein
MSLQILGLQVLGLGAHKQAPWNEGNGPFALLRVATLGVSVLCRRLLLARAFILLCVTAAALLALGAAR